MSHDQNTESSRPTWSKDRVIRAIEALNVRWIRFTWNDYSAISRCHILPTKRVLSALKQGSYEDESTFSIPIAKAVLIILPLDMPVPGLSDTGKYDAVPDWDTLMPGPAPGHASVAIEFQDRSCPTDPVLCPRTVLRRVVEEAARHDLAFRLGFELEFVVLERNPAWDPEANPGVWNRFRPIQSDGHGYGINRCLGALGREDSFIGALDEIYEALEASGITMENFHPESAPGQWELVLSPLAPVQACDALLHARRIVEAAAARRGFCMTLHPKPFPDRCGTAAHAHLSLASASSGGPLDGAAAYEPFYAGVLARFPALLAFLYPSPASYERAVDSCWAGGRWVAWGTENKQMPLRRVAGSHWELKALDGLANPYLAIAAVLSAGVRGVLDKEPFTWRDCGWDPAKLTPEEREELGITTMFPKNLDEALLNLGKDEVLRTGLSKEVVERYIAVKETELGLLGAMGKDELRQWIIERY